MPYSPQPPIATSKLISLVLLVLLSLSMAMPSWADDWTLRGNAAWIDPSAEENGADFDGDPGIQLSIERRLSSRWGVEVGALHGESIAAYESRVGDFVIEERSELDVAALTAGVNFHLAPGRRVDLYGGPLLAYFDFGDLAITSIRDYTGPECCFERLEILAEVEPSDELAWGGQIGADIQLGQGAWGLNFSARYLRTTFDTRFELEPTPGFDDDEANGEIDYEPLILGAGFRFRF